MSDHDVPGVVFYTIPQLTLIFNGTYRVFKNEENELVAVLDHLKLIWWQILDMVVLSTKAHLCFSL